MRDFHQANGAKFVAGNDMIVRWLRELPGRVFEPETTEWIFAQLAERRGAFVDVGAATGWFAIPVARTGRRVVAVEANARVRERLYVNSSLNGVTIEVIAAAASDKAGEATFGYNPILPLTSGGSLVAGIKPNTARETVATVTLDGSLTGVVAMIKIDVEGHELAVLRGAARLIAEQRPALILEANTIQHRAALDAWCIEHGYDWQQADGRNMLCLPES